mmetsp:Transcript_18562/g.62208  ORF Transcript_18562/g.62208 Transcript_18562/m.62208 type:complete len:320 (-) Transcript_18562:834-1793(-)
MRRVPRVRKGIENRRHGTGGCRYNGSSVPSSSSRGAVSSTRDGSSTMCGMLAAGSCEWCSGGPTPSATLSSSTAPSICGCTSNIGAPLALSAALAERMPWRSIAPLKGVSASSPRGRPPCGPTPRLCDRLSDRAGASCKPAPLCDLRIASRNSAELTPSPARAPTGSREPGAMDRGGKGSPRPGRGPAGSAACLLASCCCCFFSLDFMVKRAPHAWHACWAVGLRAVHCGHFLRGALSLATAGAESAAGAGSAALGLAAADVAPSSLLAAARLGFIWNLRPQLMHVCLAVGLSSPQPVHFLRGGVLGTMRVRRSASAAV